MSSPAVTVPAHWESDVVLLDGGTVHVRPMRPDDGEALVAFHERLSEDTVYSRFFSAKPRLSAAEVEHFTHVDHNARVALVAELGDQIVAIDGAAVDQTDDLFRLLGEQKVGDTITLTVVREGQRTDVAVTLKSLSTVSQ